MKAVTRTIVGMLLMRLSQVFAFSPGGRWISLRQTEVSSCGQHGKSGQYGTNSRPMLHKLSLAGKFSELADTDLLELWWSAAERGDARQLKDIAAEEPKILNLVQTDEAFILSELSSKGKDAKRADFENLGISAMHIGCMFSQPDTVSALIDLGADIHALTEDANTPLHLAVMGGNADVVKLLLDKGADMDLENDMGDTAKGMATMMGSDAVKACFPS